MARGATSSISRCSEGDVLSRSVSHSAAAGGCGSERSLCGVSAAVRRCIEARSGRLVRGVGLGGCGGAGRRSALASIRELRSLLTPRRLGVPRLFTLRRMGVPPLFTPAAGGSSLAVHPSAGGASGRGRSLCGVSAAVRRCIEARSGRLVPGAGLGGCSGFESEVRLGRSYSPSSWLRAVRSALAT